MKYYLLNGTFNENRPQGPDFKAALEAHHAYWAKYVQEGIVLISGPKMAGSGLLVIKCEDQAQAEVLANEDPFVTGGVQTYDIKEFRNFAGNDCVKEWFQD